MSISVLKILRAYSNTSLMIRNNILSYDSHPCSSIPDHQPQNQQAPLTPLIPSTVMKLILARGGEGTPVLPSLLLVLSKLANSQPVQETLMTRSILLLSLLDHGQSFAVGSWLQSLGHFEGFNLGPTLTIHKVKRSFSCIKFDSLIRLCDVMMSLTLRHGNIQCNVINFEGINKKLIFTVSQ